ncbi:hypothetical protein K0M31_017844 [Melipona bicolor]|uniref:Uncharacterized protein n=1 Tax=Melipona bicolor TaxID=60889 RepID=A0AA40G642_9HYME|nr:hypothetical protein K0M31_017844 [Melipona bicolor]
MASTRWIPYLRTNKREIGLTAQRETGSGRWEHELRRAAEEDEQTDKSIERSEEEGEARRLERREWRGDATKESGAKGMV